MKNKIVRKLTSIVLSLALVMGVFPFSALLSALAISDEALAGTVVDPSTAASWESMMGTDHDGNRYAGRVWVDRSLYKHGDTALLGNGKSFRVNLEQEEQFQVVFSALGSTMSSKNTVTSSGPMDVVLILDNSVSMNTVSGGSGFGGGTTRMQKVIEAANSLLADLMDGGDVRLGIAAYSEDSSTVLPFGTYQNGVVLKVNSYTGTGSRNGVITAYDSNDRVINSNYKSAGYANYTNTQAGFDLGMEMLANATDTRGRKPVVILLTDGAANTAVDTLFDTTTGTVRQVYYSNDIDPMIALSTLLSAAYNKATVEDHYGKAPMVYGVGVDLSTTDGSNAIIDPKNNFNASNSNDHITEAYETYTNVWAKGQNVSQSSGTGSMGGFGSSRYTFRFGHRYPQGSAVTDEDIRNNIGYVDTYFPVTADGLQSVFEQISEELFSSAFNPISSTTTQSGATGTQNTPLVYVDYIGQYMQVKNFQAVTLFGASYDVLYRDGAYVVESATGTNSATNESWNTQEDITISLTPQANGTTKLEIRINQEILPCITERVEAQTVGDQTTATITETVEEPLRIFYTIGVDSQILLPNGEIDVSKIQGYPNVNSDGTVSLYANGFGNVNPADGNGTVVKGDSHVGFKPSQENRYYYYQSNQSIFTGIVEDATGNQVTIPENNEYGLLWDADQYSLIRMSYQEYLDMDDDDVVYNYVTYWRPTPSTTDAANTAEEVTYLVYSRWEYVKESVCFVDATDGTYLNDGKAIDPQDVSSVVEAYLAANPDAELYAVLGDGSLRTSRLHNMTSPKEENLTGTATERYTPEYTYETSTEHNGNDVVVWLGNNGRLNVEIKTGIALTKNVTEAIGNADDLYPLTVTVPSGVSASPVVKSSEGEDLTAARSEYASNVLTVWVKAGETVYVSGIPAGTVCTVGEAVPTDADYYVFEQSGSVTIPSVNQALNGAAQYAPVFVTNAPYKFGNLFLTKEVESDHSVPASVQNQSFTLKVDLGTALAGKSFSVLDSAHSTPYTVTVAADGSLSFDLKASQTLEILRLPAGTAVTVTEEDPGEHFAPSYRSRNHSGAAADADGSVIIPETGSATVVVLNRYTPSSVTVDLDVVGTKRFDAPATHAAGSFRFQLQAWDGTAWVDVANKSALVPYSQTESGEKSFLIENVLEGVVFDHVGEYAYQVLEVKGEVENVTYDRSLYTFNVIVTDEGGRLVATVTDRDGAPITDGSYEVLFHNSYNTASVSVDITKQVEIVGSNARIGKNGFAFEVIPTDSSWAPVGGASVERVYTDVAGEARFSTVFERSGTYYYLLKEVNAAAAGWDYSEAEYRITVVVTVDGVGHLSASMTVVKAGSDKAEETAQVDPSDATKATVSFLNTYDPADATVDLDVVGTKRFDAPATHAAGSFRFQVQAWDGTAWVDVANKSALVPYSQTESGEKSFLIENVLEGVVFDHVGEYAYQVLEVKGDVENVTYDRSLYTFNVSVTDEGGRLVATVTDRDGAPITDGSYEVLFHNSYNTASVSVDITKQVEIVGSNARIGKNGFLFEAVQTDGNWQALAAGASLNATTNAAGEAHLSMVYDQAGTYYYLLKEVNAAAAGWDYSEAEYRITVVVTADGVGKLSASMTVVKAGSDKAEETAQVDPSDATKATVSFLNTYDPADATVDLDVVGTKRFDAPAIHAAGTFRFQVQAWDGTAWVDVANKGALVSYSQTESGEKSFLIENVLEGVVFDRVGEYAYQVLEVKGDVENVTYDRSLYTFDVIVTDEGGRLVATVTDRNNAPITDGSYEVLFHNSYNTVPVSLDIIKQVENLSGDSSVGKNGFVFEAVPTDSSWTPIVGATAILRATTNAAGEAHLSAVCERSGTYYYLLKEVNAAAAGWDYSEAEYRITITVTVDPLGHLSASMTVVKAGSDKAEETALVDPSDPTKATVSFLNTYDPADAALNADTLVNKELTGKPLQDGEFSFYVYADGDRSAPVLVGTNAADGSVDFDKELSFDLAGKYAFDVLEAIPQGAVYDDKADRWVLNGMSYDPTVYDLVVEVTNDLSAGQLVASYYFEDAVGQTVSFHNSYLAAPTAYTIQGNKLLHGRALYHGEFTFELYQGSTLLESVTNRVDGSFSFASIPYTAEGSYTYTVKEKVGTAGGVTYDSTVYTVTVTVTDVNGVLVATADLSNDQILFENNYEAAPAKLSVEGVKTLKGATQVDDSFTFRFYSTDHSYDVEASSARELASATNRNGVFAFAEELTATGTFFFVVLEDASVNPVENVVYDRTQYRYTVHVQDHGDGQLVATVTDVLSGAVSEPGAEVRVKSDFVNATFDQVTEKEVYLGDDTTLSMDGKQVSVGDELSYYITYTNYNGEAVVANIVDTIPNYTSYVEGSASHEGVCVGDSIHWTLNVAKGESVTVSFRVKVEQAQVVITNTATAVDGVNTYVTNEVINHTVKDRLQKDVFLFDQPELSIDGQKVVEGDKLLYKITFLNPTGETVDLVIRDRLNEYLAYVEGSADHDGVYADGEITWTLKNVPAWGRVSVSFAATVKADIGAVQVENQATATDGVSSYESNTVKNFTEEVLPEPTVPPTTAPSTTVPPTTVPPTSEAPVTGDSGSWSFLLLLSGGGLAVTALGVKKKKEEEE